MERTGEFWGKRSWWSEENWRRDLPTQSSGSEIFFLWGMHPVVFRTHSWLYTLESLSDGLGNHMGIEPGLASSKARSLLFTVLFSTLFSF